MENIKSNVIVTGEVHFTLTEQQAAALNAITVYGSKKFVEWFEKNLGTSYILHHKKGIESLFEMVRTKMPGELAKFTNARKTLMEDKK